MKVTLKHEHTHAGVKYPAGQSIDVTIPEAIWLVGADVIEDLEDDAKALIAEFKGEAAPAPTSADSAAAAAAIDEVAQPEAQPTAATTEAAPVANGEQAKATVEVPATAEPVPTESEPVPEATTETQAPATGA